MRDKNFFEPSQNGIKWSMEKLKNLGSKHPISSEHMQIDGHITGKFIASATRKF